MSESATPTAAKRRWPLRRGGAVESPEGTPRCRSRALSCVLMIVMGQDWGGPISMSMAAARSDRVSGIVLGNTWFWKDISPTMRLFSKIMSTGFMQRRILENNWFVERGIPTSMTTKLSEQVMEHYRAVQPTPEMRVALPIAPREIQASGDWLENLETQVKANFASKPVLLVWGMKDVAFRPKFLTRMKEVFTDRVVVELPEAKHYIQEDAPEEIVGAIARQFG